MNKCSYITLIIIGCTLLSACSSTPALIQYIQDGETKNALQYINSEKYINVNNNNRSESAVRGLSLQPIHMAAFKGNISIVEALLEKGADVNAIQIANSTTPIQYAANNDSADLIKLLISHGAKVNAYDRKGGTALKIACAKGNISTVKELLVNGADVNLMQFLGSTALMEAVNGQHIDIVKLLINSEANINVYDDKKNTPLLLAAFRNEENIFELLLSNNANILASNIEGLSPLAVASFKGNARIVRLSIKSGANVNTLTKRGRSALHFSSVNESLDVMDMLIDFGAKPIIFSLTEDDLIGTAISHGYYGERLLKQNLIKESLYYLNTAIEYFKKAELKYSNIVDNLSWKITKKNIFSSLSIVFAAYAAQTQANINAKSSVTGTGVGIASYTIQNTTSLSELETSFKLKKEKSRIKKIRYRHLVTCVNNDSDGNINECIHNNG